jgi:hypothetical protein
MGLFKTAKARGISDDAARRHGANVVNAVLGGLRILYEIILWLGGAYVKERASARSQTRTLTHSTPMPLLAEDLRRTARILHEVRHPAHSSACCPCWACATVKKNPSFDSNPPAHQSLRSCDTFFPFAFAFQVQVDSDSMSEPLPANKRTDDEVRKQVLLSCQVILSSPLISPHLICSPSAPLC